MSIVFVHVGLPKTGTTHLQDRLWRNRDLALEKSDLLYPGVWMEDHFHAAAHLQADRYLDWANPDHADAWPTMLGQIKAWPGKSLISHELLATAEAKHVRALLKDLDFADEVHVILTVRDLARQLPSVWQENVKNQRPVSFAEFLESVDNYAPGGGHDESITRQPFWEFQDYTRILRTWAAEIPAERIHIVTVPAPGTAVAGDTLWDRFLSVLGADPADLPVTGNRDNSSLTAAQTEFLRRLNSRIQPADIEWRRYERIVKHQLVGQALRHTGEGRPLGLNAEQRQWAAEKSGALIATIVDGGYTVTGTLDDLQVVLDVADDDSRIPDTQETLDAGLDALAYWIKNMPMPGEQRALKTRAADAARRVKRRVKGLLG